MAHVCGQTSSVRLYFSLLSSLQMPFANAFTRQLMSNDWQFYFLELVLFSLTLEQPPRLSVNRFLCSLYKRSPFLDPGVISESNHSSRVQVLSPSPWLRTILHGPTDPVCKNQGRSRSCQFFWCWNHYVLVIYCQYSMILFTCLLSAQNFIFYLQNLKMGFQNGPKSLKTLHLEISEDVMWVSIFK